MTKEQEFARQLIARFAAPRPSLTGSQWVAKHVRLNEPKLTGPFSFNGRQYLSDCLDDFSNPLTTDHVYVFGTGAGKTITLMAGSAYLIANNPTRFLWVFPTNHGPGGAKNFAKSRLHRMYEATPEIRELIPKSNKRSLFNATHMEVGGAIIDMAGSNSPAQNAGNRCPVVIQDEVDKFYEGGDGEPSASVNADERTKGMAGPKRFKTSSPTLTTGLIWVEFLKSNQMRRFMPCPHCGKEVLFAWSKNFTVFKLTGCEAFVKWSPEAKKDGEWDLKEVARTAHAECPHCAGKILDSHKAWMDKRGVWRATAEGAPGYVGRHLSSLYSTSHECGFGQMAKKFLMARKSATGIKGFINSDLAEPDLNQTVEIEGTVGKMHREVEIVDGRVRLLTIDCQQRRPYFWYVVRDWNGKQSHGIACGSCDQWADLDEIQAKYGVQNDAVLVDSGYGSKSDAEVYRNTAIRCTTWEPPQGGMPWRLGWRPSKAFGGGQWWHDAELSVSSPTREKQIDPYQGTKEAGECRIGLLEFKSDYFFDVLFAARRNKTFLEWSIGKEMDNETYHRHIASRVKKKKNRTAKFDTWETVGDDHLHACETLQCVLAFDLKIVTFDSLKTKE